MRLLLGAPTGTHVEQRGVAEGIHDAMAAKIRNAIALHPVDSAAIVDRADSGQQWPDQRGGW